MKKVKKILSVILSACLLITTMYIPYQCFAEVVSGSCGENAFWEFDDSTGTLIISGTGEMEDYVYSQSSDTSVFKDYRETLKNVVIGEGITHIGNYTFYNFSNIENVSFPSTLTSIGISSFYGCSKITKIMLPESVTTIGQTAFRGTNLKSFCSEEEGEVIISDNITNIGGGCFGESTYITSVHIGKNIVSSYGSFDITDVITFNNLSEITVSPENLDLTVVDNVLYKKDLSSLVLYPRGKTDSSYTIPDGTTTLFACFKYNSYIENIIVPNTVTKIYNEAFYQCTNLESIKLSESITSIPNGCFNKCEKLNNVVLPAKITSIESSAFQQCHSLSNISLNNGLKSLGLYAFAWCGQLKTITLPSTLTSLSKGTFMECRQLESINIPVNISTIPSDCFALASIDNASGLSIDFEGGVTTIEKSAFYNARFSDPLILPESVLELKSLTNAIVDRVFILNKDCIISNGAFLNCNATIVGYKNSTAEEFANNNSIKFVELCSNDESHNFKASSKSEPTCTEKGYTTYLCSICGYEYNTSFTETLGHTEVIDDAVESDCTSTGLTEGSHCSVCNEILIPQTTTDALGHNYTIEETAPTCNTDGYTIYTCERCGDSYKSDYTDALNHIYTNYVSDNNATCTQDGTKTAKCDRCGEADTIADIGSKLEHTYIWEVVSQATYTQNGLEQKICSACNKVADTKVIPMLTTARDTTVTESNRNNQISTEQANKNVTSKPDYSFKTEYKNFRTVAGIGCIKVAWSKDDDVTGYKIYTSNSSNGGFKLIETVENSDRDFCVIQNLKSGNIIYIKIVAYKIINEQEYLSEVTKTTKAVIK
ncbi:MAG: leucine-rich repeat domain-containing protein [Eubacterium sp.]